MIKRLEDIAVDEDDIVSMESYKNKLYDLLWAIYNTVDAEIAKELKFHELRFTPVNKAKERIIEKYQPQIYNDERETELVVNFREICAVSGTPNNGPAFIDYLAVGLTPFMSLAYEKDEIDIDNDYVRRLVKPLMAYEIVQRLIPSEREISQQTKELQKEDNQTAQTRKVIEEQFYYKGEVDWKFAFRQEKDFNSFVLLLTKFFTGQGYDLCDTISLKSGSKTRLARILRNIYKELSEDKMRSNERFLDIVRVLSPYKDDSNLYETLTK